MNNYKKQLKETGNDILTKVSAMIVDNNRKIPEVMEQIYD